jgi:hypothetical protein
VACEDCHQLFPPSTTLLLRPLAGNLQGEMPRQFHFASQSCNACHSDPHASNLICETCHTTQQWKALEPFDHAKTKFPLDGEHQKATCAQCHSGTEPQKSPQFVNTPTECSRCHAAKDPHGGQFRSAGREEDCATCHTSARWEVKQFNHDQTRFPLDVAHRNVACDKCHMERKDSAGKAIRLFRDTPVECVRCH